MLLSLAVPFQSTNRILKYSCLLESIQVFCLPEIVPFCMGNNHSVVQLSSVMGMLCYPGFFTTIFDYLSTVCLKTLIAPHHTEAHEARKARADELLIV